MTILPRDFPPELAAMFNASPRLYVNPPRDPASDEAARTGQPTQWMPTRDDPQSPF